MTDRSGTAMPSPRWITLTRLVCTLGLLLAGSACGNLTAGGIAEAHVFVSGDAPDPTPSAQVSAEPHRVSAPTSDDDDEPEGDVEVEFTIALVRDNGTVVPLGTEAIRVRVDLQGTMEADVLRDVIPTGGYTELEITFTDIDAEVDAGLIINGQEVVGPIDVELEGPALLVRRPITLAVPEGAVVELVIDLNTPAWLQGVDPVTATVDESVFAALVDVVAR